jgi:hypothetical protein
VCGERVKKVVELLENGFRVLFVMIELLSFGRGNAKLDKEIYTFSLPSGWTCPFAEQCLAKVNRGGGQLVDGKNAVFRCFSASQENLFSNVRISRWHNFDLLVAVKDCMYELIDMSLSRKATKVRIHVAGDFYSQEYFDAWLRVAKERPNCIFYAYTKSLVYWVNRLNEIPANFRLTASYGGKHDHLIKQYNLRSAIVVYSEQEAIDMGLDIDHDDSHAYGTGGDFALLIHGKQPKGSKASKAMSELRKVGITGYDHKKHGRKGLTVA